MDSVGLLDFTSSAFYPDLSDTSVRRLCKAREYANDVKRYYLEQARPDDNLLSTMSEILMDLVDALLASKPFHSRSLSDMLTKGFNSELLKQSPWLLRFAHSFLLVMSELEQRQLTVSEAITEKITQPPIVAAQPRPITPLVVPSALVVPDVPIKIEEEEGPSIERNRSSDALLLDVKEEPTELEDEIEELSNIASTSSSYPTKVEQRRSMEAREPRWGKKSDEEIIAMYNIPYSRDELIEMPRKDFRLLPLTDEQQPIAKYIRRKGLKRLSFKRCAELPLEKRRKRQTGSPEIMYVYDHADDSD